MACGHSGPADSHDKPGRVSKQALRVCEPVVVVTHRISSGLLVVFVVVVGPGGVLVVEGAGFKAAVQDADESVAQCTQGLVVQVAGGAVLVVEQARAEAGVEGEKAQWSTAS